MYICSDVVLQSDVFVVNNDRGRFDQEIKALLHTFKRVFNKIILSC